MTHDPNLANALQPQQHVFAAPPTSTSFHPVRSPGYPTKSSLGRDEHGMGHDCDKETETDHGYDSTTTTTDSDPPPHTPVGAATTSHCVEALQFQGDNEVEVCGVEIDSEHASASVTISLSDPVTPVKPLGRFSMPASPSALSGSPGSHRDGCESSRATVVFPSLNGSFRQGLSSQASVSLSSPGMSAQTTPARTLTPVSLSSLSSTKESTIQPGPGNGDSKVKLETASPGPSACSVSGDSPTFMLSLCSPSSTIPSPGLRKDSHGFWEPVTPVSPSTSSSSSSLPHSPSEGKMGSRPTPGWAGEKTGPVPGEDSESSGASSSPSTLSAMSRSLSPGPHRVSGAGSTHSSSSGSASFSSPASAPTSAFGGSYPSSPSPPNYLVPQNQTTLLPAFLATATVKRKKASRTREIVDRLRSSSIDEGGVGPDGLGWLASPNAGGEQDGKLGKAHSGSDLPAGNHVAVGHTSPSPPSQSGADSASCVGSDLGKKDNRGPGSKSSDSGSSGSGRKSNGARQAVVSGSETLLSHASPSTVTTTAKPSITPFPILSVSQTPASNFTVARQSQTGGTSGRESVIATPSTSADGSKMNVTVATPPNARSSGPHLVPSTPSGGTSPSTRHSHHPLPSPSQPVMHPQPPLGPPPPMVAISPYPPPMYVPFTQYHVSPPHQQGQGTWLAVYPACLPHLPMHPLPVQTHVTAITGVSGMRHVSW